MEVLGESVSAGGVFDAAFAAGTEASAVAGGPIGWLLECESASAAVNRALQTFELFK